MKPKHMWLAEYGKPKYWDTYSSFPKYLPFPFNVYYDLNDNKMRRFLKKNKGTIAELGCGNGRLLDYADIGVDFSSGMLKRAKRKGKTLVRASILYLPFKDGSFDIAYMSDASPHINPTERVKAYKEAKRVSKNFYDFLGEDRTFVPYVMPLFEGIPLPVKATAFLALLICFPIDRVRKLVVTNGHPVYSGTL
jgi:SAM-dependent methyltransferase